jgi:site-specific DNA recombinase
MVAEYERAKILERSRRGKRHKAQAGQISVLSRAPYGYRYVSLGEGGGAARYEIVPDEARIVRQVFEWVGRERATISEVCRRLERQQIPTAHGNKQWQRKTIHSMLKNPAYQGMAAYGRLRNSVPHPVLRPRRGQSLPVIQSRLSVPAEEWIHIPVPAIVEPSLFAAVQQQLEENRMHARILRQGARYLLQGLVVCKQCGYSYYGQALGRTTARKHPPYAYYRCVGGDAYRFGGQRVCHNPAVRVGQLEQAVWHEVCALLNDPQRLQQEYHRRLRELAQPADDVTRAGLNKQLRQCRQGVARLIDAYTDGYVEKIDFETRIRRLKDRQLALEQQCRQLDADSLSLTELQLIVGRLEDFSARVKSGLDTMDFASRREVVRALVKRVEIDYEQVNIVFRVEAPPHGPALGESLPHCGERECGNLHSGPAS